MNDTIPCCRCNNQECELKPNVKKNIAYCNECDIWFTKDLSNTEKQE